MMYLSFSVPSIKFCFCYGIYFVDIPGRVIFFSAINLICTLGYGISVTKFSKFPNV